jgi:hypothetical protein
MKAIRVGLVVAALVATLTLSGCDRDPAQALRVGDFTLSNTQVDETAQGFVDALIASGSAVEDPAAKVRESVVQQAILKEVARRYAAEKGISVPAPDYEATAANYGLDVNDPYVRLTAETSAYVEALRASVPPRQPTEDEMRQVYADFVKVYQEQAGPGATVPSYADIRSELVDFPEYSQSLAVRDELLQAMDRYGVIVNPRYQPVAYSLLVAGGGALPIVTLPLGQQSTGAVRAA